MGGVDSPCPGQGCAQLQWFPSSCLPARVLPADTPESSIAYRVLEVYPRRRLVLITCHVPQAPPPVTYTLWGSGDILVTRKVVTTPQPASFTVNVTLKSSPDLLTYSCQAASSLGAHARSARLQLYWELWASEQWLGLGGRAGAPGRRRGRKDCQLFTTPGVPGCAGPASHTPGSLLDEPGNVT